MEKSFSDLKKQERKARQDIIISAAERVFASKPFNKVTIRDIAGEAHISPTLIYRYFPDQQTLFVEAFLKNASVVVDILKDQVNRENTSINDVCDRFIDFIAVNEPYFRMMVNFMVEGALPDEQLKRIIAMERSIFEQFDRVFERMNYQGNIRLMSHALLAALNGIILTYRNYPDRSEEEIIKHMKRIAGLFSSMFMCGIDSIKKKEGGHGSH